MATADQILNASWEPPEKITREECIADSQTVLKQPDLTTVQNEDIFRINTLDMDWDIGVMVYEPEDSSEIPRGPDNKKIGVFLLHRGAGDYRAMEDLALLLTRKYGYKVVSMTNPGRLYLEDPDRNWPGDTVLLDGTVRTPIWKKGEIITPDQYEVVKDLSKRSHYGTRTVARAKKGTAFYYRMAAWPVAFEESMQEACRRHFPLGDFSIYGHGHSTGGPFVSYLTQRVPNFAGIIGIENTPFGYIYAKMKNLKWTEPFYDLTIRTWRDLAKYLGPEAFEKEGPEALMRLPWLMEEVFEDWEQNKIQANFKAEYIVTSNAVAALTEAAQETARRLNMSPNETDTLVNRYIGYTRELTGPDVKPVPPLLLGLSKHSRNHRFQAYRDIALPMFAAMTPPPKVRIVQFDAGVHFYTRPEKDLPMGITPAVTKLWNEAIMGGYYLDRK